MEFFDKLSKKATEAYKITADKTGKIAKETKNKMKMNDLKCQISDLYEEIGKKVYEKHVREEEISIKDELEEQCTKIDVLSDEIESLLKESLELNDKKQCPNCHTQLSKDAKYCDQCGYKQEENTQDDEKENVEKSEEDTNTSGEESQSNENEEENRECTQTNLETTVEVETNPQIKEGDSEEEVSSKLEESQKDDSSTIFYDNI